MWRVGCGGAHTYMYLHTGKLFLVTCAYCSTFAFPVVYYDKQHALSVCYSGGLSILHTCRLLGVVLSLSCRCLQWTERSDITDISIYGACLRFSRRRRLRICTCMFLLIRSVVFHMQALAWCHGWWMHCTCTHDPEPPQPHV